MKKEVEKKRVLFTIDEKLLEEFNKAIPDRDRSQTIEALIWMFLRKYRKGVKIDELPKYIRKLEKEIK